MFLTPTKPIVVSLRHGALLILLSSKISARSYSTVHCESFYLSTSISTNRFAISRSAGVVDTTLTVPSCHQDAIKARVQTELDGRTGETDSEASAA